MRNGVEKGPNVEIENPYKAPAPLPCSPHGFGRRFTEPIPIGIGIEVSFQFSFQLRLHHPLRNPVRDRRNTQRPRATVTLLDRNPFDWRRKVAARRQSTPKLEQVVLHILVKGFNRLFIDPGCATVCFYPFVSFPNNAFGNIERFCLTQGLLPQSGWPFDKARQCCALPGFPDNLHLYDRVLPDLSPARRVITFDFLGWGASDKPA